MERDELRYETLLKSEVLKKGISEDDTHKYYLLTAEFGVKTYQAYLEWCREAKVMLKEENK